MCPQCVADNVLQNQENHQGKDISENSEPLAHYFSPQIIKLMRRYSHRVGVSGTNLRFVYEGRRIRDVDTPGSLEMESGDYIEVRSQSSSHTGCLTVIQYEGLLRAMHGSRG